MRNFVSVNLMTHSKNSISQLESHNKDREDIDYLLNEEDRLENYSETFSVAESVIQIVKTSCGTYEENLRNFYANYKASSGSLKDNFDFLENVRKSQQKEKGFKDKQKKHLIEFVVSLSEEQTKEYIKNGVDVKVGFEQYIKDLEKMGIHSLQWDFHNDEGHYKDNEVHHNFHAHIIAYNYNFETKKAIASNFRKKDYRKLQTLAQNSFIAAGLDYKRGNSKLLTNKSHLSRNELIAEKKQKELKKMYVEIDATEKNLQNNSNLLLSQNDALENLKSQIQEEELKVEDYQKWFDETKIGIKDFIKLHIIKKDKTYQIKSISEFYNELVELVSYVSNFDLKLEEIEKQKSVNQVLKAKIESLNKEKTQFLKALEELKLYERKIKLLVEKKNISEDENYQLKQFIIDKNLEDNYNYFISNIKKEKLNYIER